jgi:hypothetical protein
MFRTLTFSFAIVVLMVTSRSSGDLSVENWDLASVVIDPITSVGDSFQIVENPFVESHSVSIGLSTASASYDFSWSDAGGNFQIDGSQRAHDSSNGFLRSDSTGHVIFGASQDLLFTVDAEYSYNLPTGSLAAALIVAVVDNVTFDELLAHSFLETFPGTGVFEVHDQIDLPAGREYRVFYHMRIDAFENTGAIGTGDGFVHFTLQSVPEPTTLGFGLLGSVILLRRRAR